ncbi:hypothetical protein LX36DRAFT_659825 [Colletotrichum falcatum]|nr:hypothetical protein LX36DRAFT_659825 [Colletotrichum falcatum]
MDRSGQGDAEVRERTAAPGGDGMKEGDKYLNMARHHQQQDQQEYVSGLEVAAPGPWNPNDIPLPEVVPKAAAAAEEEEEDDAKTASPPPHAADDAHSWHHYYKQNPGLEVSPAYGPGGQKHPPGYHHPPAVSLDQKSLDVDGQRKLCGMRRKLCYVIMVVTAIFGLAAISIGVGVSLASRSADDSKNIESTKTATIVCPAKDNDTFSAQVHPSRHFRLICGHDFNSADGAIDLASRNVSTMAACIDLCAANDQCVGAGWGNYYGSTTCWMKSRLGNMNTSGNWLFAVDVDKAAGR